MNGKYPYNPADKQLIGASLANRFVGLYDENVLCHRAVYLLSAGCIRTLHS
jgi:hypothetical protein